MKPRTSLHFRVGLVLLGLASAFTALVAFILGGGAGASTIAYFIAFDENVKGMVVGSKVNFQGVPAGTVTDIRFRDGQSLVRIEVAADKCLVQDVTRARLDRLLVTGQVTVELEGFERGRPRLAAGSFVAPRQNRIDELAQSLPEVLDTVPTVLHEMENVMAGLRALLDPATRRHAQSAIANLDALLQRLLPVVDAAGPALVRSAEAAPAVLAGAEATFAELRLAAADVRAVLAGVDARAAVRDVAGLASRLQQLESEASALVAEARSLVAGSRGPLADTLLGIRDATRDARALFRLLQLAPSSLLYGRDVGEPAAPIPGGSR